MKGQINELALFAGAGGGILGGELLGWRTVCAVEINKYARRCLMSRQDDGSLEPFPIWDDVTTFDGKPWRGLVDVISGGFPCQDISVAGNGKGLDGERSGLWGEMARIIGEVRPEYVLVENSPALAFRGGLRVVADLTRMGYGCQWGTLGPDLLGADHHRARLWLVADADVRRCKERWRKAEPIRLEPTRTGNYRPEIERPLLGMDDGLANWVDRLHAVGNGQVPCVVELAWKTLTRPLGC